MDDDRVTCEICMEKYDNANHIPKQVPCCNNNFCISCLKDIYKRNKNSILCPICRKSTKIFPSNLPTDDSVLADFLSCLNCKKPIIKSEINISLNSRNLSCVNCANNDMNLNDFLEYIAGDLNDFIKEYSTKNEEDFKQRIQSKISVKLNALFTPLIQEVANELSNKIVKDIEMKYHYNIDKDFKKYMQYITELQSVTTNIDSFIRGTQAKVKLSQLQKDIQYYTKNFDEIKNERNLFDNINNFIKTKELVKIKMNDIDMKKFLVQIIEPENANGLHNGNTNIFAIDFFDKQLIPFKEKISKLEQDNKDLENQIQKLMNKANNNDDNKRKDGTKKNGTNGQSQITLHSSHTSNPIDGFVVMSTDSNISSHDFGIYDSDKVRRIDIYED